MVNMNTPYDDAFRTLLTDCSKLIIPIVNEIFHEHYTGRETIVLKQNEIFLKYPKNEQEERITDTSFTILDSKRSQHYHIECQSTSDGSMIIRMYEYDSQIALKEGKLINNTLEINFPQSSVLYLRHSSNTPDKLKTIINTPGGSITYDVPIMKVKLYNIDKIFEKKLLILIPFYIFTFEKQLPQIEKSKGRIIELKGIYEDILSRLNKLCESGELDEYTKKAICDMAEKVINSLAKKYKTVRKEVTAVMGGKVLEYEAKTILRDGIKQGMEQGIEQSITKLLQKNYSIEEVAAMLDQDIELVRKIKNGQSY